MKKAENKLTNFIEKIEHFSITNCEMTHELIKREENSIMPLPGITANDSIYLRGNPCEKGKRDNLGCAHTGTRLNLIEIIKDLIKEYPIFESIGKNFILDIKKIEWEIIELDTQRQNVELAHANISKELFQLPQNSEEQQTELNKQLEKITTDRDSLILQHNQKNEKIKIIREELLKSLNTKDL